ncbi:MAG: TonB-dependent receptor [Holophagaceae bacterium]|nr:TonB-dependent receptor [Holophagaceae bacterium]
MTSRHIRISGLIAVLIAAPLAAQQTSGAVRGQVKAKKGGVVANAGLVLRSAATGFSRTLTADAQGNYQFNLMPVGVYELSITAPGMRTLRNSSVQVSLGQTTTLNFTMDSAEASTTVEVVAVSANLDTQQVSTNSSIDEKLVESIPLNGRDFTNLVNLTPGTAFDPDNNRVSVEGARGIQNNLTIDGASYNSNFFGEQRGSTRIPFAFGADTIKELQIITNAFDAQYGNAAGAIINAISKTGTNDFSGTALFQIRPKSLVAKIRPVPYDPRGTTNTDQARTKNFSQTQFNMNVGGALIKDKLFYFIGVETYKYKEDFTPNFAISSSGGNSLANFTPFLATFGNLVMGNDGRTLTQEAGRNYTNDRTNTVYFGRLDWSINENHRASLRVNAQDWKSENGTTAFSSSFAPSTGQTSQGLEKNSGLSWVLELNSILGSNLINEARVQRAIERRPRFANSTAAPEFQVNSGFNAGQNNFLPNGLDEYSWQIIDNLTWTKDDWSVKGGVDIQLFDFKNTFFRYQNGSFQFGNYQIANKWAAGTVFASSSSSDNLTYAGAYSDFGGAIAYQSKLFAGYVQGQYQGFMNRRLLLSLGVRVTREAQPDNPRPNPLFNGLDQANSTTSTDPRFGFTFDLNGRGKTLIRGGYGLFSSPNPSLTVSNTMNSNGNTTSTYFINNSPSTNAFFNTGALSFAQRVSGNRISSLNPSLLAGLGSASKTGQVWDPTNKMTLAKRTALGLDHSYDNGLTLGVQGVYAKFENLQYFMNINLNQVGAPAGSFYNDGYAVPGLNKFSTSGRPNKAVVRGHLLDFTGFGNIFLSQNGGEGTYKALILTASMRNDKGWGFNTNVTFSKAEDNNSNERTTASSTADSNVNDPSNPLATIARSSNDRPFRFVFAGYFPVFFGIKGAVNFSYNSGAPYSSINTSRSITVGGVTTTYSGDLNGDGGSNDYSPDTVRNGFRQPHVKQLDLRLTRNFEITKKYQVETFIDVFNVLNWANQRTTRTTGTQGNFTSGFVPQSDFGFIDLPDRNTREVQFGVRAKF